MISVQDTWILSVFQWHITHNNDLHQEHTILDITIDPEGSIKVLGGITSFHGGIYKWGKVILVPTVENTNTPKYYYPHQLLVITIQVDHYWLWSVWLGCLIDYFLKIVSKSEGSNLLLESPRILPRPSLS